MNKDCLFCKIASGETPCKKIYEDENVLAFLDIFPHAKGHTVIIPKKHFSEVSEMSAEDWQKLAVGLAAAAKRVEAALKPEGMNIGANDRPAAGQVVPHVHWHIFPRWKNDGGGSFHSIIKTAEKFDLDEIAALFK